MIMSLSIASSRKDVSNQFELILCLHQAKSCHPAFREIKKKEKKWNLVCSLFVVLTKAFLSCKNGTVSRTRTVQLKKTKKNRKMSTERLSIISGFFSHFQATACPPPPYICPPKFLKLKYIFVQILTTFKKETTLKICISCLKHLKIA